MKPMKFMLSAALLAATIASPLSAGTHIENALAARQSLMTLIVTNIRPLGAMAQAKMDYDADVASRAAKNLSMLTSIDQMGLWPEGSDSFELGDLTRANIEIWDNFPDFQEKMKALNVAAIDMEGAAGGGLDSLRGSIRGLVGACAACHKLYRAQQ